MRSFILILQRFNNLNLAFKLIIIFIALILIAMLVLLAYRKHKQNEIMLWSNKIISNNGISELRKVNLNGSEQYIYIEAVDKSKPIVLFLHGGPGAPYPFGANSRGLYPKLSENAIAVFWDQRGTGKSYNKNINADELTITQFVSDTNALVDYLLKEFNRDKVHIVAASWGTIPAIKVVQQNPEKFYSYISYAQLVDMKQGESLSYNWMLQTVEKESSIKQLKEISLPPFNIKGNRDIFNTILTNDSEAANKIINGKKGASVLKLLFGVLFSPDYKIKDIWNTMGSANDLNMNKSSLTEEMHNIDFLNEINSLEVPVYFIHGKYDMIVPTSLTFEFYQQLNAPLKAFKILENSAHIPSDGDFSIVIDYIVDAINNRSE